MPNPHTQVRVPRPIRWISAPSQDISLNNLEAYTPTTTDYDCLASVYRSLFAEARVSSTANDISNSISRKKARAEYEEPSDFTKCSHKWEKAYVK